MSRRKYLLDIITHVIGIPLALAGTYILLHDANQDDTLVRVNCLLFGGMFVLMYLASTVYHTMAISRYEAFWDKVDRAAIFFTIAASVTAILCILPGIRSDNVIGGISFSTLIIGAVWLIALVGTCLEFRFGESVHVYMYGLYFLQAILGPLAVEVDSFLLLPHVLVWTGNIVYAIGAIYFFRLGNRYELYHAGWHISVLLGSVLHFFALWLCL